MAFAEDKETLAQILEFVEKLLNELRGQLSEDRPSFDSAWLQEVQPALQQLVSEIRSIPSETGARGNELVQRGLTGEQLKLKRARLASASRKGLRGKILDILNTILGSIPGADPIKEYKELVEEALGDDPNATVTSTFA